MTTITDDMKALSINQPWAWLIVNGYKPLENRSWDTKFRGEFLIHAGKKYDDDCWLFAEEMDIDLPPIEEMERGGIVGKARLINTVHESHKHLLTSQDKPWFFGPYGFILDSAEPLPFRPCKGALGFFTPDYNSRYVEKKKPAQKISPQQTAQGTF